MTIKRIITGIIIIAAIAAALALGFRTGPAKADQPGARVSLTAVTAQSAQAHEVPQSSLRYVGE